ncbi:MAG: hypothetical protein DI629_18285 [Mesorhizobium amorphae]|nr:MAG: hypothetical protein DI629_18285 [Mesorhizobium amorphae]
MPDQPKRPTNWRLADAHDHGQLVAVRCNLCRVQRNYRPGELRQLFGDVLPQELESKMRCAGCGSRDYLHAWTWAPSGQEMAGLVVRRLVSIRIIRRPVWRDERA